MKGNVFCNKLLNLRLGPAHCMIDHALMYSRFQHNSFCVVIGRHVVESPRGVDTPMHSNSRFTLIIKAPGSASQWLVLAPGRCTIPMIVVIDRCDVREV